MAVRAAANSSSWFIALSRTSSPTEPATSWYTGFASVARTYWPPSVLSSSIATPTSAAGPSRRRHDIRTRGSPVSAPQARAVFTQAPITNPAAASATRDRPSPASATSVMRFATTVVT